MQRKLSQLPSCLHTDQSTPAVAREYVGLPKEVGISHGRSQANQSLPDDVMSGLKNGYVLQRFKLVNKVALVTGETKVILTANR